MTREAYASFGAGVQSTALAMLAINRDERLIKGLQAEAEFMRWDEPSPIPAHWIFADTGDEPVAVYENLERMRERLTSAGFELHLCKHKSGRTLLQHLQDHAAGVSKINGIASPPFFSVDAKGKVSKSRKQCTRAFKIRPVNRKMREVFGLGSRGRFKGVVTKWLGISSDEIQRMKASTKSWERISHPLVFMRWDRALCLRYLQEIGVGLVARSSCVYCPFRTRSEWADVMGVAEDKEKALLLDDLLDSLDGIPFAGVKDRQYLLRSCESLSDADFNSEDKQADLFSSWDEECDGVCGV